MCDVTLQVERGAESRYVLEMINLTDAPVSALLALHGDVLAELRRREVVRSANKPTGDYGGRLFAKAFGWPLNGNSSADADAVCVDGCDIRSNADVLQSPADHGS